MENKTSNGDSFNNKSSEDKNSHQDRDQNKNKKLFILLGVLAIMIIIVIIVAAQGRRVKPNSANNSSNKSATSAVSGTTTANAAVSLKSKDLQAAPISTTTDLSKTQVANLKTAKVVVPGANPITKNNVVVTPAGLPTNTNVRSIAPNAPKQTGFLNKATLPKTLAQVSIADGVFSPRTITTKAGAPTSFALTSADNLVHVLNFKSPELSAIVILVGPGQTKAITFNAPKAGSYTFYDSTPGSTATGTLIVE